MGSCGRGYYVNHVRDCFENGLILKVYYVESSYLDSVEAHMDKIIRCFKMYLSF